MDERDIGGGILRVNSCGAASRPPLTLDVSLFMIVFAPFASSEVLVGLNREFRCGGSHPESMYGIRAITTPLKVPRGE